MSKYQQPIDKSYLKRKLYNQNTIKISKETNHLGQHNIEIVKINENNSIMIKQYQLYPQQINQLISKNEKSINPSHIEYIGSGNQLNENTNNQFNTNPSYPHPEYSNNNNPSHLTSYQQTIDVKNKIIRENNISSDISGFDSIYTNYSDFISDKSDNINTSKESCNDYS